MIRSNDVVLHKPSGEIWVVCGVDHSKGELIPCGYPFPTLAKISDFELIEEHYSIEPQTEEQIQALRKHGLDRFVEVVRHGEWIYGEYDIPHCSECGYELKDISPYCPECGANMEGERSENGKGTDK